MTPSRLLRECESSAELSEILAFDVIEPDHSAYWDLRFGILGEVASEGKQRPWDLFPDSIDRPRVVPMSDAEMRENGLAWHLATGGK